MPPRAKLLGAGGALRVTSSGTCRKGEKKLALNQRGPQGQDGRSGTDRTPGTPGAPGRSALDALHSGETIHGVWGMRGPTGSSTQYEAVTFPIPAEAPVDSAHVVMSGNDVMPGDGCTGTAAAPASGPGFVCVYFATAVGTTDARGFGAAADLSSSSASGDGSSYGFGIQVSGSAFHATGTWPYTAP